MSEKVEKRYQIIRSIGEECIQEEELKNLLSKKAAPICYDGFEPSGRMHIALLNNRMGDDLKKIRVVGEYFQEIWKAAGMDSDKVEFLWSSEEIHSKADKYWPLVMDIARKNKLPRILRCGQIMGRNETDKLSAAQILYPGMECADVFFLEMQTLRFGPSGHTYEGFISTVAFCRGHEYGMTLPIATSPLNII